MPVIGHLTITYIESHGPIMIPKDLFLMNYFLPHKWDLLRQGIWILPIYGLISARLINSFWRSEVMKSLISFLNEMLQCTCWQMWDLVAHPSQWILTKNYHCGKLCESKQLFKHLPLQVMGTSTSWEHPPLRIPGTWPALRWYPQKNDSRTPTAERSRVKKEGSVRSHWIHRCWLDLSLFPSQPPIFFVFLSLYLTFTVE